jgi:hypothetical protein
MVREIPLTKGYVALIDDDDSRRTTSTSSIPTSNRSADSSEFPPSRSSRSSPEEEHALNQEIGFGAAAFLRELKQAYEAELRMAQGEQARKDAA